MNTKMTGEGQSVKKIHVNSETNCTKPINTKMKKYRWLIKILQWTKRWMTIQILIVEQQISITLKLMHWAYINKEYKLVESIITQNTDKIRNSLKM